MLAPHAVVTALAGSPSEEPIAVIYGSSDVHESAPLPLTNPQGDSCHVSVSEGWMDGWIDWGGGERCACPQGGGTSWEQWTGGLRPVQGSMPITAFFLIKSRLLRCHVPC